MHTDLEYNLKNGVLRILMTERCNALCSFCGQGINTGISENRDINTALIYKHCLPLYNQVKLLQLSGGELTISKEGLPFCDFISQHYPAITISTESNGIAFTRDWQEMAATHLFHTHFSVNAPTIGTFTHGVWAGSAGEQAYEKITENIQSYLELLRSKQLLSFAPTISMVINKETAPTIRQFVKKALSWQTLACIFYFDVLENDLDAEKFKYPEISLPALYELIKIKLALKGRFYVFFDARLPTSSMNILYKKATRIPRKELEKEYADLLLLAKDRSLLRDYLNRQSVRLAKGKKTFSFEEELAPGMHEIKHNRRKVCFVPWKFISIYPSGHIGSCCFRGGMQHTIQDLIAHEQLDWNKFFNSEEIKTFRNNIINGEYTGCAKYCPLNPNKKNKRLAHQNTLLFSDSLRLFFRNYRNFN